MNKKIAVAAIAVILLATIISTGIILGNMGTSQEDKSNRFTYSISAGNKTYSVVVEANWDTDNPPTVTLSNGTRHAIELYFLGGTKKIITYNISFPEELIGGNISLVWKYYLQNPDRYILSSNGTYNVLGMTFDYDSNFSGMGYFEILGTEGAQLGK
jgi:hypothetical protein